MKLLYHEKQEAGLCGVHCLNTLLQGQYFGPEDLAEIGRSFDENERRLMLEMGETKDFLKFMAEDSGNVADDGFFSVQVLGQALNQAFGLSLVPIKSEAAGSASENPTEENAFICNLQEHWFTIRKVDGQWYNFNSLQDAPSPLSEFYLRVFLDTLLLEGYEIFVVRGELPRIDQSLGNSRNWKIVGETGSASREREFDEDLHFAIQASMRDSNQPDAMENSSSDEDSELAAAIAASLGPEPAAPEIIEIEDSSDPEEDDELQTALLLSQQIAEQSRSDFMSNLPESDVTKLLIELPQTKSRVEGKFYKLDNLQRVLDFVKSSKNLPTANYEFVTTYPSQVITDMNATLESLGLHPNAKLFLRSRD